MEAEDAAALSDADADADAEEEAMRALVAEEDAEKMRMRRPVHSAPPIRDVGSEGAMVVCK